MPDVSQSAFPTIEDVTSLVRTALNDTFPGLVNGVLTEGAGRVWTDANPKMLPALNSSVRTLMRKLRIANLTFPTKKVVLFNVTPVQSANGQTANSSPYIGFDGYFDGETMHPQPALPSDCLQVTAVWEQSPNSTTGFIPLFQPQGGIINQQQGFSNQAWEWRQYRIYLVGSIDTKNLQITYNSGQPPLNVPAADFPTTSINILDSTDALAYLTAAQLASSVGAADVSRLELKAQDAIDDMVRESVRAGQSVTLRRQAYGNDQGNNVSTPISGGLV